MKNVVRLAGEIDEVIKFSEIEDLVDSLISEGYELVFRRNIINTGWDIDFQKDKVKGGSK
jgi:hypothetical protein